MQSIQELNIHIGLPCQVPMGATVIDWDGKTIVYILTEGVPSAWKSVTFLNINHAQGENNVPNGFALVAVRNGNSLFMRG